MEQTTLVQPVMLGQFCVSSRAVCRRMLPVVARTAPSTQLSASSRLVVTGNFPSKQTSHSPCSHLLPPHRSWCCWIHFPALPLERSALSSWCVFCSFVSSLLRPLFLRVQSVSSPVPHNKQHLLFLLCPPNQQTSHFSCSLACLLALSRCLLFTTPHTKHPHNTPRHTAHIHTPHTHSVSCRSSWLGPLPLDGRF
jgi:hypothetical protein